MSDAKWRELPLEAAAAQLLPCPFCGSRAFFNWGNDQHGVYVECSAERASPLGCNAFMYRTFPSKDTLEHLIQRWNKRT